ncbi:MAG TPA: DUF3459 domain-containing protein [Acidobacteriaceae bacterium]|nr:DUF3459 domain-containing protein [Acidobacteriaceae bacterium]
MLHWYQQLIALKQHDPALHSGQEIMLNTRDNHVLSWLRRSSTGEAVVVACNFTAQPETLRFDLNQEGVTGLRLRTLLITPGAPRPVSVRSVPLGPYGVYIGQVE